MATQLAETPAETLDTGQDTGEQQSGGERDWNAEAIAHGWRPLEEFKGDPRQFVDAETYVKRADEVLPFVKKENKQLRGKIEFLERQIKKVMKSEQEAYSSALADVKAKMEKAVVTGDVAAFNTLDKKAEDIRKNMAADTPGADRQAEAMRAFNDWRDKNEWYDLGNLAGADADEKLKRAYADRMMDANVELTKTLDPADFFEHIAGLVDAKYPPSRAPRPKGTEAVAGVTRGGAAKSAKTGANLPAQAKETAERYVRQGIPGYKGKTKAEAYDLFAKDWDWS